MVSINKNSKKSVDSIIKRATKATVSSKKVATISPSRTKIKKVIQDFKLDKIKKVLVKKTIKKTSLKNKKIGLQKKKVEKKIEKNFSPSTNNKTLKLKKVIHNPIISPSLYGWESKATFNPAAFEDEGKVYIVYRAAGDDDSSVLGYAISSDGLNIEERPTYCIYKRNAKYPKVGEKIDYISGGGWNGGCEDPRLTLIDDTLYLVYTAFDGWSSVRMALTSISLSDFKKKKWNWKKEVMISPPGEMNKNWVIFPEKINGKFAIMHSFYPKILINYFDSLDELDGKKFIKSNNTRPIDDSRTWDSWFRGVGPTPIKTEDGWLVLYHAMDHKNPDRYRMGALLLDLNDPTKILHRSKNSILEPEEDYENNGHKWGVVYSCGAVIKNKELLVYYGGADKFVCVASVPLKELVESIRDDKTIKLKNIKKTKNK